MVTSRLSHPQSRLTDGVNKRELLRAAYAARAEIDTLISSLDSGHNEGSNIPQLLSRSEELIHAAQGQVNALLDIPFKMYDFPTIQVACEFDVFSRLAPYNSGAGAPCCTSVAKDVGLSVDILRRILKHLATMGMVKEMDNDTWARTWLSERITEPRFAALYRTIVCEPYAKVPMDLGACLMENPDPKTAEESAFKHLNGMNIWQYYSEPAKAQLFALAMEGSAHGFAAVTVLKEWITETGRNGSRFIDVGGSNGLIAIELAKEIPNLTYEVQDINPPTLAAGKASVPPHLASRFTFTQHDYFTPQPKRTDVLAYHIRWCLHDLPDDDCVRVLRQFVPPMEKDRRIALLVHETILPERGEWEASQERVARRLDMAMLISMNAKERTAEDWMHLVQRADKRLVVTRIIREKNPKWHSVQAGMGLLEVYFKGGPELFSEIID